MFAHIRWALISLLLPLIITSCSRARTSVTESIYVPPTLAAESLPQPPPTTTPISPSPTPVCSNELLFLRDISIPDGSVVAPSSPLDKRWLIENTGTCNWDEQYSFQRITGPEMGVAAKQALYPARSGSRVMFSIRYTAPESPGIYHSAWQAHDPQGEPFGDPVFIEIIVQ